LVMRRLSNCIGRDGALRIISQPTRSQAANRELAVERFMDLMREALRQVPIRRKTRVSRAAKEQRLEEKRHRSLLKLQRARKVPGEN